MNGSEKFLKEARAKVEAANEILGDNPEQAQKLLDEADGLEAKAKIAKSAEAKMKAYAAPVMDVDLPTGSDEAETVVQGKAKVDEAELIAKNVLTLRYQDTGDIQGKAMLEVFGGDYRQVDYDQTVAFRKFVKSGETNRILKRQVWPAAAVKAMLDDGLTVAEIKATMVEGVDVLGGYAVPPEMGNEILKRTRGLTAVRDAGARVVQTAAKSIEWLKITQGGTQYPSAMRGAYGGETATPAADNWEFGLINIPAQIYTYKVPFSASLLEDASNVMGIFMDLVADTLAIDEDIAFLIGDGANKPYGLLPGQANANSLTEVNSGAAAALTIEGLKKLRRGVDSQYRLAGRATLLGNSQAGEDIELFQDGTGRFYYDALTPGQAAPGGFTWRESEALPDPAANTFSLIYGDFSGYTIVERLGLAIQRYNDSNTGINVVEFHIRRRIGGAVTEPWKFAVQKVAA